MNYILIISNHFSLPNQPGAPRPWKLAEYFVSIGWDTTVITNKRHYLDEHRDIETDLEQFLDRPEKLHLIYVNTSKGRRESLAKRLLNYLSFSFMALKHGLRVAAPDVIITGTPPLVVPLTGILLGKIHKSRTILEIRDLYPDTAVALGKVSNRLLIALWDKWEQFLRNRHDYVVGVVPHITKAVIGKGVPPQKTETIENGYDLENDQKSNLPAYLEEFFANNQDRFVLVYAGGMGYAYNLMTILQAAECCLSQNNIVFAFFGEGEQKQKYINYVKKIGLSNCYFFPAQPRRVINTIYRRACCLTLSYYDQQIFTFNLPNKIFEYHGAGRPVIFAGKGRTAQMIAEAKSGMVVVPENPRQYADAVVYLAKHPEIAKEMGQNARQYILDHYLRQDIFKKWDNVIKRNI